MLHKNKDSERISANFYNIQKQKFVKKREDEVFIYIPEPWATKREKESI